MQTSNLQVAESTALCFGREVNAAATAATTFAIANSVPAPTADQTNLRLVQLQIVLLIHADKCRSNDNQLSGESTSCSLPICATMKGLLSHMRTCQSGKQCTVRDCACSSQIISHWNNCTANDCPVCAPLKQALARSQQAATVQATQSNQELGTDKQRSYAERGLKFSTANDGVGMNNIVHADPLMSDQVVQSCSSQNLNHIQAFQPDQQDIQQSSLQMESMSQNNSVLFPNLKTPNVINENCPSQLAAPSADLVGSPNKNNHIQNMTTDDSGNVKDRRLSITMNLRRHLVQKIVKIIFPAVDFNTLKDSRMVSLVSYAEKAERDAYKNASDEEEYYHLLAVKTYKKQKELEDKRQNGKENRLPQQSANDCPVCVPFKQAYGSRHQAATVQANQSNQKQGLAVIQPVYDGLDSRFYTTDDYLDMNAVVRAGPFISDQGIHICSSQNLNDIPNLITDMSFQDWKLPVSVELRHQLVQKIIRALIPAVDMNTLNDSSLLSLVFIC
ncbi:CREB-binding protein [Caerostris extrusa]|uniref:histone acetyltransferase n=1 Tax=Caerostris extrusa TaxID=172846 RepID=A0AAV4R6I6_CAEEX|nr:CREB-binding protein [Caerostris extrusa]